MATSSITANFYTDDPKAANSIVRALFTDVPATVPTRHKGLYRVAKRTSARENAFFAAMKRKYSKCPAT